MAKKKVNCPYVNGHQPDCTEADTDSCETCVYNQVNRREITYYRKFEGTE